MEAVLPLLEAILRTQLLHLWEQLEVNQMGLAVPYEVLIQSLQTGIATSQVRPS
jgi:hypothetical protein